MASFNVTAGLSQRPGLIAFSKTKELGPQFDATYTRNGRPTIPPEKLLRALLLQVPYMVRSEHMLMEQLDYNFLFRWFA